MSICQLQNKTISILLSSFCLVAFYGCAETQVAPPKKDHKLIVAQWNKLELRFSDREIKDESYVTHPFFDIDPQIAYFKNQAPGNFGIRYVVTTPKDSKYQYNIDLYSGKLFRERAFCAQDDIWDNYRGDLMQPNFTQGIVPRVYDENKNPQRVIVFSNKEFIEPFKEQPIYFDETRIIGSFLVESCLDFPCDLKEKWKASQILIGVSLKDPEYRQMDGLSGLRKKAADWSYAKGMLTNMHGYHQLGSKSYPAYRISRELGLKDSLEYFEKNSKKLNTEDFTKMNEWRVGCMKLYDSMWSSVEKIRAQKSGKGDSFLNFFKDFYAKSSNEFYECQKLVRPANIVEDHRRMWFFTYIQAFTLLEKNRFYYSCNDNVWAYNPKVDENKFFVDQNKELSRCRAKNFDKAFDQAINGMSLMKNQTSAQFRFVEFDNVKGGSHQKIYGWLYDRPHNYACKYQSKTPAQGTFDIFPQDVVWENFYEDDNRVIR